MVYTSKGLLASWLLFLHLRRDLINLAHNSVTGRRLKNIQKVYNLMKKLKKISKIESQNDHYQKFALIWVR